ncbi:MAG: HNH endonuclease [bacterium]
MSFRRTSVYRKIAFGAYDPLCAHCGFGIPAVLEVAHIDGNRQNNDPVNLIIL